jgi:hypothetical protein
MRKEATQRTTAAFGQIRCSQADRWDGQGRHKKEIRVNTSALFMKFYFDTFTLLKQKDFTREAKNRNQKQSQVNDNARGSDTVLQK